MFCCDWTALVFVKRNMKKECESFNLPSSWFSPSMTNIFSFWIQKFSLCINRSCNVYFILLTFSNLSVVVMFAYLLIFFLALKNVYMLVLYLGPFVFFYGYLVWCWKLSVLFQDIVCCIVYISSSTLNIHFCSLGKSWNLFFLWWVLKIVVDISCLQHKWPAFDKHSNVFHWCQYQSF